jgi:hypothetical protein
MDQLKKLESIISKWLKPVPNLPQSVKKWLSENVWWLAIISLVVSVISALVLIGAIVAYSAATAIINVNAVSIHQAMSYMTVPGLLQRSLTLSSSS